MENVELEILGSFVPKFRRLF